MNKNIILGIIGAAVIGGGVWYMARSTPAENALPPAGSNDTSSANTSGSSNTSTEGAQATGGKTTMQALIDSGIAQRCTFVDTTENSNSAGVVYVGGGNLRGDFVSSTAGKTIQSHMIVSANMSYVWDDTTHTGMKMPSANLQGSSSMAGQGNINKEVDYTCEPWSVDTSKFSPPSGISFTDISAMMEGMPMGR